MATRLAVAILILSLALPVLAQDVTGCGAVVPANGTGTLQADLAGCVVGVTLGERATLALNGHTIGSSANGVICQGRNCTVTGPGAISGGESGIVHGLPKGHLRVMNVAFDGNAVSAISANGTTKLLASSVTATHNGLAEYSFAIIVGSVIATDLTVSDNAGVGVYGNAIRATRPTATGNGHAGVFAVDGLLRLTSSTVTGNNGFDAGIDILSQRPPRLVDTTCGLSAAGPVPPSTSPGPSWGVCTNDPA